MRERESAGADPAGRRGASPFPAGGGSAPALRSALARRGAPASGNSSGGRLASRLFSVGAVPAVHGDKFCTVFVRRRSGPGPGRAEPGRGGAGSAGAGSGGTGSAALCPYGPLLLPPFFIFPPFPLFPFPFPLLNCI